MALDFDPYSVLGVTATSSSEEIKTAYRQAARRLHPDANHNPGAVPQFQDVTAAYELLLDIDKRRAYDRERSRQPADDLCFSLNVAPSKRGVIPLPEPQVIYLLAEILPDPRAEELQKKNESRLNLTLVLDNSNSMNGPRLEKVKVAAHQIIDQMSPEDILSVITFNDRAEVVIPATPVKDKAALKARISMTAASGSTEIFKGLSEGVVQNRKFLGPRLVNHLILLTDGNTYGDHTPSVELARQVTKEGMSISAMGLGHEWNDKFLDELASATGGTSSYINSAAGVVHFLNNHVRNLSNIFAERVRISIAPDPDVRLESAFKLSPHPQPLNAEDSYIPLGSMQAHRSITVLFQLELPANMPLGFRTLARVVASGDVMGTRIRRQQELSEISLEVTDNPSEERPPTAILDALGKLTLYRMHERAQEALEVGDVVTATHILEHMASGYLERGEDDLAQLASAEAETVAYTRNFSDKGQKALKYQTRMLVLGQPTEHNGAEE